MVIVFVIAGMMFLTLALLLLAPFRVYVNTASNEYYISLQGIARFSPRFQQDQWVISAKVPFYTFEIPLKSSPEKKKEAKPKKERKKRSSRTHLRFSSLLRLLKRLIRSFRVRKLYLDLDTGSYPLNAQLVPLFLLVKSDVISLNTNFQGVNRCEFLLTSRPIKMVWPFVQCFVLEN